MDVLEPESTSIKSKKDEGRVQNEENEHHKRAVGETFPAPVLQESQYQSDVGKSKQMEPGMAEGGIHKVPV